MHFVILGAGAVGSVLGALLAADGHRVQFWVRPSQRATLRGLTVHRVGGTSVQLEAPSCLCPGDEVPATDWVLVCVRGEQLDDALRDVAVHMGATRRVAIAAVSLQRVTEQARAAGLEGPVYALHASFGSFAEPERPLHYRWFPFDLPTTVTPDGQREHAPAAHELARTLAHAGLPARSARSMNGSMRFMVAMNSVLALGWDLCGWQLARLVRSPELRSATARAMHEAARVALPPRSWLRPLPAGLYGLALRVLALGMGRKGREVWLHHGPKIRPQTDAIVRQLVHELEQRGAPAHALRALQQRWQASLAAR